MKAPVMQDKPGVVEVKSTAQRTVHGRDRSLVSHATELECVSSKAAEALLMEMSARLALVVKDGWSISEVLDSPGYVAGVPHLAASVCAALHQSVDGLVNRVELAERGQVPEGERAISYVLGEIEDGVGAMIACLDLHGTCLTENGISYEGASMNSLASLACANLNRDHRSLWKTAADLFSPETKQLREERRAV